MSRTVGPPIAMDARGEKLTTERALLMRLERELEATLGTLQPEARLAGWHPPLIAATILLSGGMLGLVAILIVCAVVKFMG